MAQWIDPGTNSPELLVRRFNPGSGRGYDDMLWISLLDWIPEPKGLVVQTRKRLDITSHRGESTECGITKLGVRSGSQLLTRAID